jgi:hypothetical protein
LGAADEFGSTQTGKKTEFVWRNFCSLPVVIPPGQARRKSVLLGTQMIEGFPRREEYDAERRTTISPFFD